MYIYDKAGNLKTVSNPIKQATNGNGERCTVEVEPHTTTHTGALHDSVGFTPSRPISKKDADVLNKIYG